MSWLTPAEQRRLGRACADYLPLGKIYQVGSSLTWTKGDGAPRDIDLRMLLPDDQFDAMAPAQWEVIADAIGAALEAASGVGRIDFQIQPVTVANAEHPGPRAAIFLSARAVKAEQREDAPEPDPLDENDHRDRIDGDGRRWGRMDGGCWHHEGKYPHAFGRCSWTLQQLQGAYGLLTFAPEAAPDAPRADLTASEGDSGAEEGDDAVEALLCPKCGHGIDDHDWSCLACDDPGDCRQAPSDIARHLIARAVKAEREARP